MQTKFPIGSKIQYNSSSGIRTGIVCEVPFEYVLKNKENPRGYAWAVNPSNVWAYWEEEHCPSYVQMEYYTVTLVSEPVKEVERDKYEYLCVPQKTAQFPIENYLNNFGEDGWELVAIDYGSFIFKREVV